MRIVQEHLGICKLITLEVYLGSTVRQVEKKQSWHEISKNVKVGVSLPFVYVRVILFLPTQDGESSSIIINNLNSNA